MFCPICKAEYRLGFTRCSDCLAPLVEFLADTEEISLNAQRAAEVDPPELLWSGVDPRPFSAIRQALDAAGIPYNDERYEASLLPNRPGAPLVLWIRRADHDRAQKLLVDALGGAGDDPIPGSTQDVETMPLGIGAFAAAEHLPSPREESFRRSEPEGPEPVSREPAADFYAEDATAEVWLGDEPGMAAILEDCLRENGIGSVVGQIGEQSRILVLPNAEVRARQIIREVIDATFPE
jgi:hypothetical protein